MTDRRSFFRKLVGGAAAVVVAPEILARIEVAEQVAVPMVEPSMTAADIDAIWKKVQGQLAERFQFVTPEWEWADGAPDNVDVVQVVDLDTVPVELGEGCASD